MSVAIKVPLHNFDVRRRGRAGSLWVTDHCAYLHASRRETFNNLCPVIAGEQDHLSSLL